MSVSPARSTSFQPARPAANSGAPAGLAIIQIVLIVSLPVLLQSTDGQRAVVAMVIATLLFAFVSQSPSFGVPLALFYVALMSGIRRWLIPVFGYTHTDPLVIVMPVILVMNFVTLLIHRQIPRDTLLSRLLLWLLVAMGVEALNPGQGGLAVGFGGLLLLAVPLLWYYLARQTVTPKIMRNMFNVVFVLAILCACYGLYQQYVGFLQCEIDYMRLSKYSQILSRELIRVFSTFSGFAEYTKFIGVGTVVAFSYALKKNRLAIFVALFLFICVFLSSSRGALASTFVTCVVLWAVQGSAVRTWWPRLAVAAIVGICGFAWTLKAVHSDNAAAAAANTTSEVLNHQQELLDPLSHQSTGANHLTSQLTGIASGFSHPFGYGTGSVTLAAGQYASAGATGFNVEGDFGNSMIALGLAGGLVFFGLCFVVSREAFLNWIYFRDLNSLCCLAVLLINFGQWLSGADYSLALLIWFIVGYVDLASIERRRLISLAPPQESRLLRGRGRRDRTASIAPQSA